MNRISPCLTIRKNSSTPFKSRGSETTTGPRVSVHHAWHIGQSSRFGNDRDIISQRQSKSRRNLKDSDEEIGQEKTKTLTFCLLFVGGLGELFDGTEIDSAAVLKGGYEIQRIKGLGQFIG